MWLRMVQWLYKKENALFMNEPVKSWIKNDSATSGLCQQLQDDSKLLDLSLFWTCFKTCDVTLASRSTTLRPSSVANDLSAS